MLCSLAEVHRSTKLAGATKLTGAHMSSAAVTSSEGVVPATMAAPGPQHPRTLLLTVQMGLEEAVATELEAALLDDAVSHIAGDEPTSAGALPNCVVSLGEGAASVVIKTA